MQRAMKRRWRVGVNGIFAFAFAGDSRTVLRSESSRNCHDCGDLTASQLSSRDGNCLSERDLRYMSWAAFLDKPASIRSFPTFPPPGVASIGILAQHSIPLR